VVQGRPIKHPSHAIFVHFPSALLPAALVFDVLSFVHADLTFARAAFYDIALGLFVALPAIVTGLVDYLPMIGGSHKKKLGTYHLLGQLAALPCFALSLLLRAFDFDATQTPLLAFLVALAGAGALSVANYFGGELVYRQGMRVSVDM